MLDEIRGVRPVRKRRVPLLLYAGALFYRGVHAGSEALSPVSNLSDILRVKFADNLCPKVALLIIGENHRRIAAASLPLRRHRGAARPAYSRHRLLGRLRGQATRARMSNVRFDA